MVFEGQHPFHQYSEYSSNSTSMASPSENTGWFKGLKNWWNGESQPTMFTPREAAQKNLELLNQHVESELDRCIKYNKEIEVSSPRSAAVARHKQTECFDIVVRLQRCTNQVNLNAARTSYEEAPSNFMSAMGTQLGEGVSQIAAPILQELAENGIRAQRTCKNKIICKKVF